ncbi:hypothetical protein A2W48_02570 [Candidatus Giovannonibacteria bacterium RIFCSPHIGHO2_12_44_12]|uniref:Aspartyl/glutamyl-tRNA(Asn/Gln) amidotransferase subunit C n=3 Tax=Candidatus Giovannoniibacteriota TaxID=1752738 RepID=A0A1F5WYM7_9BACT|nr:MAG: Aspartyl/glutamyl-tRNA(Asn/Gln) amidotransferase subunit C [Candidatus Giovannonibacteria bacterium GW2011_GWC2_44_8]OGF80421.1 MAG: hypothetical protein A2W48_02570 [Candidatus Giovannonibacteria bacterium RIFCSPHIGHO2_12_44_12]OGF93935.1 MAG: hypothetical protein A2Y47_00175 [Candidatus Giovannonibacteria bacterium RIFCSPLOWO2_12_43_8]
MISKDDIKKLAELARIHLTAGEEEKLEKDLSNILGYVEKLKEVDISNVPEMTHAVDMKNVFRNDDVRHRVSDNLVEQFPEEERGYLKVKGVFERE